MSKQIARDILRLQPTQRPGHTEYSMNYHHDYIRRITGLDPETTEATRKFYDLWDIDLLWMVNDGIRGNWAQRGRCTDMGHAEYAADGSDIRKTVTCPFTDPREVWAFDAVTEYGLPEFTQQVKAYQEMVDLNERQFPGQICTGGYYKTIVSGAIQAFGWEMLLMAAADPERMEQVWDSFFQRTLFHMRAWAETSAEVIIQHDDFVWTSGAFMHPEIYRKMIIPRYAELWKPIHASGKKVLFCADGNFMEFAGDVAAAGADGFIFEPCNDFAWMIERFGSSHVLIGSCVDCRDMTFSEWRTVREQIDHTLELARGCNGFFFAVGNHIPANVTDETCSLYIDYLQKNWKRTSSSR